MFQSSKTQQTRNFLSFKYFDPMQNNGTCSHYLYKCFPFFKSNLNVILAQNSFVEKQKTEDDIRNKKQPEDRRSVAAAITTPSRTEK